MGERDSKNSAAERATKEEIIRKSLDSSSVIIEPPTRPNQQNQEKVSQQPTTSKPTEDKGKK